MARTGTASRPGSELAADEQACHRSAHDSDVCAAADPLVGRVLPGGHTLLELVGTGGMGRVYRAEQTALGRTVAIKFVHPHLVHDETIQARFLTEARAASQLNHPNSVSVIDFGLFEGAPYLVMEYLWGDDLAAMIAEDAPFEHARIAHLLGGVLEALAEAHHLGIVHRDLKPENIIVQRLRSNVEIAKVLDFGLAKLHEQQTHTRATVPGLVCGTPQFMSPEQVRGETVDGRADLYACGVILFEMLTGVLPFDASSVGEIIAMQLNDPPPDPRFLVPDIDERIVEVVLRALAKPVTERFQSATEFAVELRSALLGEPDREGRHSGQRARCHQCRAIVRLGQHFCGHCGSSLTPPPPEVVSAEAPWRLTRSAPPRAPSGPSSRPPLAARSPSSKPPASVASRTGLLGRANELEELSLALVAAAKGPLARRIVGPPGVGKSSLLRSFERTASAAGARIVRGRPDGWRAQVRCAGLRQVVTEALGATVAADAAAWAAAPANARLGQARLFGHATVHETEQLQRWSDGPPVNWHGAQVREQLTAATRWAIEQAAKRAEGQPLVLTVDELEHVDGATIAVLGALVAEPPDAPLLIVGAHASDFTLRWPRVRELELSGLAPELCAELLARLGVDSDAQLPELDPGVGSGLRPIVVEQLHWLLRQQASRTPDRLADMVALRHESLSAPRRRMLQLLAVHGILPPDVECSALGLPVADPEAELARLRREGWLEGRADDPVRLHSLIREVVLGAIPHEARRQLHERAFDAGAAPGRLLPIEVRVYHGVHAERAFESLVLIEHLATRQALVDDLDGATLTLRRGVELAREEISRGTLDDPIGATAWFASRLGDVLTLRGETLQAEGVVREALDAIGPASTLRPRLLASLAFASHQRGRRDQAHAQLDEAMKLAQGLGRTGVLRACTELRQSWALR